MRSTDFNRFQEKIRKGAVQLYYLGWNADHPDPENFMFLLNGAEGKWRRAAKNASNFRNAEFDRLFAEMKNMENSPQRLAIINRMNRIPARRRAVGHGFPSEDLRTGPRLAEEPQAE